MKQLLRYIFPAVLLLVSAYSSGQISFVKVYSGNGYDKGEGICQLADSGFLVTGSSSSFEDAPSQAFLMRLDSVGNVKWSKAYGGSESETGKRVISVKDFGYFVAGTSSSSGSGNFDNYLFFTDEDGNEQWQVFTDKGGWERINDAALVESDTSIITVGQTDEGSDFVDDIYICRYSKTGELIWDTRVGSPQGSDVANAVQMYTDTSFLVAGSLYNADSAMNKAYLALFHVNGQLIWSKTSGNSGNYWLNDISLSAGVINTVGEAIHTGHQDYDSYVVQYYANGVLAYAQDYHFNESVRTVAVVKYTDTPAAKHFVAEQVINSTFTFEGGEDALIQRNTEYFNWDGYGLSYSGPGQDQINQMEKTSDGFAVAIGFNTFYGSGGNSVTVIKIGNDAAFPVFSASPEVTNILNLDENNLIENLLVYPNPVADKLTIKLENKSYIYTISDLSGRKISEGSSFGETVCDFSNESQGSYFLTIVSEGKTSVVKIIR